MDSNVVEEVKVVVCEEDYKVFGKVWNEYVEKMLVCKDFDEYYRLYCERNEVCGVKENMLFN